MTIRWHVILLGIIFALFVALRPGVAQETTDTAAAKASDSTTEEKGLTSRQATLIAALTIFVLAVFVGFEVIAKVPPTLHTPLMSGSNAISGITVVGALIAAGAKTDGFFGLAPILGLLAIILATINVVGGFWVTHRMLGMFQRKK